MGRQPAGSGVSTWSSWRGKPAPIFAGRVGEMVEDVGGEVPRTNARARGGEGGGIGGDVGRPWRRFRLREPEVRDGPDRWGPPVGGSGERREEETVGGEDDRWGLGSHLSEREGGRRLGVMWTWRRGSRAGPAHAKKGGKEGRREGKGEWAEPKDKEGILIPFLFI
uniref:Uncharacterized protein n=1 Tax=Oryza sativa subsp. indica TaxID=39946 RepID=A0A679BBP3_ORYSI|nr:hypothetical protein [Oryza sativa Indica Group]BBD82583.1 hypothetical protein [Oryza sativa Indica Group]